MRYLVTGAGLLGAALATRLRADGHEVILGSRRAGEGVVELEILRPDTIARWLDGVDAVFHTAGIHGLRQAAPGDWFRANVGGTWNVCEAAAAAGIPRLVHASTVGVYGDAQPIRIDATTLPGPAVSEYNLSKQVAEKVVAWWARRASIASVALRLGAIRQTVAEPDGALLDAWARSGGVVDLQDAVGACVAAVARLPLPRDAYVVVPSGGEPDGPYQVDASATERDLGYRFVVPYASIRAGTSVAHLAGA
jgi:nucleoside-diphosphate-sugar epimerase